MLVPDSSNMFHPVGYQALFGNILKGLSIQKRPPEAYCDMCVGVPALEAERLRLDFMLKPVEEKEHDDMEEDPATRAGIMLSMVAKRRL